MAVTNIPGTLVKDGSVQRKDLDIATAGEAVIRKAIAGTGISFASTGTDPGTGDVTVNISTVPVANGGTNLSSYAVGDLLFASGATALSKLAAVAAGSVLLSQGVTTAPAWGNTIRKDSIGATSTDGWILENAATAAAGAQQWSPRLRFRGRGWKTDATAGSQVVDWAMEVVPVQGAANPTSELRLSSQINAGGYTARIYITSGGSLGIGITPAYPLHVVGGGYFSGGLDVGGQLTQVGPSEFQDNVNITAELAVDSYITGPDVRGSISSGGNLTLHSTTDATKGKILFGTSGYDEVNNRLGLGTASPSVRLHVSGASILATNTTIDPDTYANGIVAGTVADGSGFSGVGIGGNNGTGDSWGIVHNGGGLYFGMQDGVSANTMQTYMSFETNRNLNMVGTTGNVGIKTSSFGTNAVGVLGLGNGTAPTTSPADMVQLFSVDLSAGNATLGIRTETAVATETVTSDRTLSVKINGTTFKILLKS